MVFTDKYGKVSSIAKGAKKKLTYSSYVHELIDMALVEGEKNIQVFKELLTTLYLLNTDPLDYELLIRYFELKLLKSNWIWIKFRYDVCCGKEKLMYPIILMYQILEVFVNMLRVNGMYISKGAIML